MRSPVSQSKIILKWLPRALATSYILFISIFALDVFGEGYRFYEVMIALFMHLLPTFILIALTILAWKKEVIGGFAFIFLGIGFTLFFHAYKNPITFLIISIPVFLIGTLFLFSGYLKKKITKEKL